MKIYRKSISSPIGDMMLLATDKGLCLCDFIENSKLEDRIADIDRQLNAEFVDMDNDVITLATNQLNEYFAGKRQEFTVPLDMVGSDFQKIVWKELLNIPYGKTISYADEAKAIYRDSAVRAVALANSFNKLLIFIPCHRVIGSDGNLTGFASGLDRKEYLLNLESKSK